MTDQADGPNVSYQPQGEGPHPTLAGNMFDPGVKADGTMGSSHEGVGGTDEKQVRPCRRLPRDKATPPPPILLQKTRAAAFLQVEGV